MSKIVAILPCRNSAWVLGLSARALLMWVDELHILEHACTDATGDIICDLQNEFPHRVFDLCIDSGIWQEMSHRNLLLESARAHGATHIVTIDDDEVLTGNLLPTIRQWVENVRPGAILTLPWLQLRGSIDQVISTGMWAQQPVSVAFRDEPAFCWATTNGYDHHHRHPCGRPFVAQAAMSPLNRTGGIMHLQMVSDRRLRWKHLHYKLTEHLRWPEKPVAQIECQYNATVNACVTAETQAAPPIWWHAYRDLLQYLDVDAEPWQRGEALRIMREHPGIEAGLTMYGIEKLESGYWYEADYY